METWQKLKQNWNYYIVLYYFTRYQSAHKYTPVDSWVSIYYIDNNKQKSDSR